MVGHMNQTDAGTQKHISTSSQVHTCTDTGAHQPGKTGTWHTSRQTRAHRPGHMSTHAWTQEHICSDTGLRHTTEWDRVTATWHHTIAHVLHSMTPFEIILTNPNHS